MVRGFLTQNGVIVGGDQILNDYTYLNDIISQTWDRDTTYKSGAYVFHANKMWKCLVTNVGIEPPNATHWEDASVSGELASINENLVNAREVIWNNPNPTNDFSGQLITCDWTNCNEIEIGYRLNNGNAIEIIRFVPSLNVQCELDKIILSDNIPPESLIRVIRFESNGIRFYECNIRRANQTSSTINNALMKPISITKIKYPTT